MTLKRDIFIAHITQLYKLWNEPGDQISSANQINTVDSIFIVNGNADVNYCKTISLNYWLFGAEFNDTAVLFTKNCIRILTSGEKNERYLAPLVEINDASLPKVLIELARNKDIAAQAGQFTMFMQTSGSGVKVGVLDAAKFQNDADFCREFYSAIKQKAALLQSVDIAPFVGELLAVKDAQELTLMRRAAELTIQVYNGHLLKQVKEILDEDHRVRHSKISEGCENYLARQLRQPSSVAGACYPAIVQSGHTSPYELKFSVESNQSHLAADTIIISFGAKFQNYCANVIRTLMIDPQPEQVELYQYLAGSLYPFLIGQLNARVGQPVSSAYRAVVERVRADQPQYAAHLTKSFGFVTGLEFRDGSIRLYDKCAVPLARNQTWNVNIGFENVPCAAAGGGVGGEKEKSGKKRQFSLWIGDVVLLIGGGGEGGGNNGEQDLSMNKEINLTVAATRKKGRVTFHINDEDEEEAAGGKEKQQQQKDKEKQQRQDDSKNDNNNNREEKKRNGHANSSGLKNGDARDDDVNGAAARPLRGAVIIDQKTRQEENAEQRRHENQVELYRELRKSTYEKLSGGGDAAGGLGGAANKLNSLNASGVNAVSYSRRGAFSDVLRHERDIRHLRVFVDTRHETIILPIQGRPYPIHVASVKNATMMNEAEFVYLRINLHTSGSTSVKSSLIIDPLATYIKEITFRARTTSSSSSSSANHAPSLNLIEAHRLINDIKKKFTVRETETREQADVCVQEKLRVDPARPCPRLKDVYVRPSSNNRRIQGQLEAHANGLRFISPRHHSSAEPPIEILYANVRHAFFQPCDHEMIVLIHFHLRKPIMINKRKHLDVQFYTEVGEITTDLSKVLSSSGPGGAGGGHLGGLGGAHYSIDRDDLESEQRDREMRRRLDNAFKEFCKKIEGITDQRIEFDVPYRNLGFYGCTFRSNVLLQPTNGCLVQLSDWPTFVLCMEDVDFAYFERVCMSIRNFDITFIPKDYTQKPVQICAVPSDKLDHVKSWINSIKMFYSEGIKSLNWTKILKSITDDPKGFLELGDWKNILEDPAQEDEEDDEDEVEDGDEEYRPSDSDKEDRKSRKEKRGKENGKNGRGDDDEENDDEEDSESGSSSSDSEDYDSEEDWEAEEESESASGELDSDESEGKDWDELEVEARRSDARKDAKESLEVTDSRKRVAGSPSRGAGNKAKRPRNR